METGPESNLPAIAGEFLAARIDRREFFRKAAAVGVSGTAAAAFLAACGSSTSSGGGGGATTPAKKSGTLVYGPLGDGENYDPATNDYDYPTTPFPCIYEGLTGYVPGTWDLKNVLAESIEKSTDGKRYAFKLREGVMFHHGFGEMTAAEVKYSLERSAGVQPLYPGAPKSDVSYYSGDLPNLDRVQVTGKYTGVIIFKEPFTPFETITLPWATSGLILPEAAVDKYRSTYPQHPVGTGPYEVASYTPNSEMILRRFADYSGANHVLGARNEFDEIRIMMTPLNAQPKGEALTVALQSGESDFTPNLGALDTDRLSNNSAFKVYLPAAPLNYYFFAMDVKNPKLADVRVRQAIRYALNIPEILEANHSPLSTRLNSLISKEMGTGYWADAPVYDQNVAMAKSLLTAAGANGISLDLATPQIGNQPGEPNEVMTVIQSNLEVVGITVNIIETPPDSYVAKAGFGQLMWQNYGGAPDPYYQFEWFTCSQIGVWNYASWCDPAYTNLENQLGVTTDPATRDSICIQMQKMIDDAASYVWMATSIAYAASASNLQAVFDSNGNPQPQFFHWV